MNGYLANWNTDPNQIERTRCQLLASGRELLDLTCTNLTLYGPQFPLTDIAQGVLDYLQERRYRPNPKGMQSAREAIANYYHTHLGYLPNPDHIFITASTSEAYRILFSVLADPGDDFLIPNITYPLFEHFAADQRLELTPYKLTESNFWQIDPQSFETARGTRSRGIIIVSPHNPTGAIHSSRSQDIVNLELPIIADEVFAEFLFDPNRSYRTIHTLYEELPVCSLGGFSKMFALPDLKFAWIILNEVAYKRFGTRLELLNDTYLSANGITQALAPLIFSRSSEFTKTQASRIRTNLSNMVHYIQRAIQPEICAPEGGINLIVTLPQELRLSERDLVLRLLEAGVFVHPGYFYSLPELRPRIVLSAIPSWEILERGLDILSQFVREIAPKRLPSASSPNIL